MAKMTGLGQGLWVDGVDLSGDIMRVNRIEGGPALLPGTAINQSAAARLGGQRSGHLDVTAFLNPTAGAAHPTLDTLPRTDRQVTYRLGGAAGSAAATMLGLQINYDGSRGDDGSMLFNVQADSDAYGLEWGVLLTGSTDGLRTDTAATNGTGLDTTASASLGLQAYLHVFSFTGTSVTVKLQGSSDDGAGDPYADITGAAFTAATAAGVQRIATANNVQVKRYVRAVSSGTFSSAVFGLVLVKNTGVAVSF